MTQQNAALVEESAAAAESLREQSRQLAGVVAGFRLDASAARTTLQPVAAVMASPPARAPAPAPAAAKPASSPAAVARTVIAQVKSTTRKPVPAAAPARPAAPSPAPPAPAGDDWESF